jgi:hypothetical protein
VGATRSHGSRLLLRRARGPFSEPVITLLLRRARGPFRRPVITLFVRRAHVGGSLVVPTWARCARTDRDLLLRRARGGFSEPLLLCSYVAHVGPLYPGSSQSHRVVAIAWGRRNRIGSSHRVVASGRRIGSSHRVVASGRRIRTGSSQPHRDPRPSPVPASPSLPKSCSARGVVPHVERDDREPDAPTWARRNNKVITGGRKGPRARRTNKVITGPEERPRIRRNNAISSGSRCSVPSTLPLRA